MPNLGPFLISGLSAGALYALSAVSLVVLYRASGVVNLAQGAIGALAAIIVWQLLEWKYQLWIAASVGIVASMLVSLTYGRLIAHRLSHTEPIIRAVATLGLALVVLGFVNIFWGDRARILRLPTDTLGLWLLGVRITYTRAIAMGLSLAIALGMAIFLRQSRLGLAMRALANHRETAALLGIPVLRVDSWAWIISGVIAGICGILLANLARMQPQFLTFMIIPVIAAAIAGRMRSLAVAAASGLVIGVIEALATPLPAIAPYRTLTPFVFAILALLWLQRSGPALIASSLTHDPVHLARTIRRARHVRQNLYLNIGAGALAAVAIAVIIPLIASAFWLKILSSSVIFALAALATAVIYAQLGMVSLCQYALVGVGAWFTLRLWHATHLPFEIPLLFGGVCAAIVGLIFGLPALRMRGLYLALATLMIAGGFQVIISAIDFPDGGGGILGKTIEGSRISMDRPFLAMSDSAYLQYCLAFLAVGYLIVFLYKGSRVGRAWATIRRSEACALSASVNIVKYKALAFALAGFLAGISGGLLAGLVGQMDAQSFPASESIILFVVTLMGGAYGWLGPILAGLLARAVPGLLNDLYVDGNIVTVVFGAGLLHALIVAPNGLAGQLGELGESLRSLVGREPRERIA